MLFSSLSFLYIFLPLVIIFYFSGKKRTWRNTVLLAASLLFYAWGDPSFLVLVLGETFLAWLAGLGICRFPKWKRLWLAIAVGSFVLILIFFKHLPVYFGYLGSLQGRENPLKNITLPLGISFFTFQIMSYVVDLYRDEIAVQRNYFRLLLYVSLFPQIVAGPIVRYRTIEDEITVRNENTEEIFLGLCRFIAGLAKKLIIANGVGIFCEIVYSSRANTYGTAVYWLAGIASSLQIYFDFSAYSDMAIGLGRIFGFHFSENFNYPLMSKSVSEIWHRWHISLSSWFRDYVYFPLGGSRCGKKRTTLNILIVWLLTGLWHGPEWNFLLWAIYNFVLISLEKRAFSRILSMLPSFIRHILTLIIFIGGTLLFRNTDLHVLLRALHRMICIFPTDWTTVLGNAELVKSLLYMPIAILFCFPFWRKKAFEFYQSNCAVSCAVGFVVFASLFIICNAYLLGSTYNPFIYFRF